MDHKELNWKNLRVNKCPKCSGEISLGEVSKRFRCSNVGCGFSISQEKFQSIVGDMNKEAIARPEFAQSDVPENLRKFEEACSFCHTVHSPEERCAGFG